MIERMQPSDELMDYVQSYQNLEFQFHEPTENYFAAGISCWLVIVYGDPLTICRYDGENRKVFSESYVVFPVSYAQTCIAHGDVKFFDVELKPPGVQLFTGQDTSLFTDKICPLSDFVPANRVRQLEDAVTQALHIKERAEAVESFLKEFVIRKLTTQEVYMHKCRLQLKENPEPGILSTLAAGAGISEVYFRKKFKQLAGMSPKHFMRIARFNNMITDIHQKPGDWLETCTRFGYHDQAHLIKDFKAFAGCTPKEYMRRNFDINIEQIK